MRKTSELKPGDVVFWYGLRVVVEMVSKTEAGTFKIRHSHGSGTFEADARWLVEQPLDDIIEQAERHMTRGEALNEGE